MHAGGAGLFHAETRDVGLAVPAGEIGGIVGSQGTACAGFFQMPVESEEM
jgi:hypothetical protein